MTLNINITLTDPSVEAIEALGRFVSGQSVGTFNIHSDKAPTTSEDTDTEEKPKRRRTRKTKAEKQAEAAAAEAAGAEADTPSEAEVKSEGPTLDDARAAVTAFVGAGNDVKVVAALLKKHGAARTAELAEAAIGPFLEDLQAAGSL